MRLLGQLLLFCLVISALQGALAVLLIGFLLVLLLGLIFRTEQTVGLLAIGFLLTALQTHTLLTIGALALLAVVAFAARWSEAKEPNADGAPKLLPPSDSA